MYQNIKKDDIISYKALINEFKRQNENIELIASENFTYVSILEAQGSVFTNKYAEGYPDKRYYGGCKFYDIVEKNAIKRAKKIFNAEHANVQPHSGTQANMAVYLSVLNVQDVIMAMSLKQGGHLSHGHPVNFSGKFYKRIPIEMTEDGFIDYEKTEKKALKYKPKLIVTGASAYPRIIDFKRFKEIADKIGALLMADIAHIAGLVAAKIHPAPFPYSDFVTTTTHKTLRGPRGGIVMSKEKYASVIDKTVFPGIQGGPLMHIILGKAIALKKAMTKEFKSYQIQIVKNSKTLAKELINNNFKILTGGTDNHMLIIDLRNKKLTGKEVEEALDKAAITVNKNSIPNDEQPPFITSGIRIGTPSVTSRGMKEKEMKIIASFITDAIKYKDNNKVLKSIRQKVIKFTKKFPVYRFKI